MNTTFVDGTTTVVAAWLNDVNVSIYEAIGDGTNAPTTATEVKTNLSLNNVDNTSDADKPISTATQTALNLKQDASTALTITGVQSPTNKTISLSSNTLSGTIVEFNTALSDGDFTTLAGTETLTNKTITSPKIKAGQFGNSGTATNNFTLTAEAADGTIKLARGNVGATTQDILTVDAAGKVAFPQNAQVWTDVTASRAINTNYTNNTGQTIDVSWRGTGSSGAFINILVGGVVITQGQNAATASGAVVAYCRVPAGDVYRFEGSATEVAVMELR